MLGSLWTDLRACFSRGRNSLLNREKFPGLREFWLVRWVFAAFCCISGAESRNIIGLLLIFFGFAGARTRARTGETGGG